MCHHRIILGSELWPNTCNKQTFHKTHQHISGVDIVYRWMPMDPVLYVVLHCIMLYISTDEVYMPMCLYSTVCRWPFCIVIWDGESWRRIVRRLLSMSLLWACHCWQRIYLSKVAKIADVQRKHSLYYFRYFVFAFFYDFCSDYSIVQCNVVAINSYAARPLSFFCTCNVLFTPFYNTTNVMYRTCTCCCNVLSLVFSTVH